MEQENNNYQPDAQAFLDSLSKEDTTISPKTKQEFLEEEFPFTDDFDIDAFVAANDNPLEKTLTAIKASPVATTQDTQDFNIDLQKDKDENIQELESKINDIQNQIEDTSKEQTFSSLPSELFEEQPTQTNYVSSIKANDEFFTNISSTIDTLKGSLDNIVKARLQYEEGLVRQDQNLIARLREKTSRLKAINLALNSEVKRAKNEKLESLRKSAEQTKELLALRMQINQFQEQSDQGNFKVSRLEQQLNMAVEEKKILEDEIAKIRQEKLDSFKASAEQTRQIMALRFDLAKTEEKFKEKEAQTLSLKNQLEDFKQKALTGDKALYQGQIDSLKTQLDHALLSSKNEAGLAGSLRENILVLETSLAKTQGAKTALLAKAQEHLENLFGLKNKYEQEIGLIRDAQFKNLEKSYQQETQKSAELTNQVKQTLSVCRHQEGFIKTLQMQIDSFKQAIADLEKNPPQEMPSSEVSLLKDAHLREISSLQQTLQEEQNKYRNQNLEYQNLVARLSQAEQQKQSLEKQVTDLLSAKEENQKANNQYLSQIEELKKNYETLQSKYNLLGTQNADKQVFDLQKNALEDELKTILTQKIALLAQVEQKNRTLAAFKAQSELQTKQLKEDAQKQISVLENKLASTQEKLKNEEETVNSLKAKISDLETSLASKGETEKQNIISQEISSLKEQLVKAQGKFAQESVLLSQLREESASKNEEFTALETKYKELIGQKETLQKQMEEQAKQIETLQTSLNNLQQELQAEKAARLQLEDKVAKLKAVNVALSAQIKQTREQKVAALKKSAEQAKEILALKEELSKAGNFKTVEFENGLVKIREEYETKISDLEKQLADLSERFAKQVQEIEALKTDNTKLKQAQEEKFSLEEQYNNLTLHAKDLESQIVSYQKKADETALAKAKAAALTMQLTRIKEEKKSLAEQLDQTRLQIKTLDDNGKEAREALTTLRTQITQNDDLITKLKQDISALKQAKEQDKATIANLQAKKEEEEVKKSLPQVTAPVAKEVKVSEKTRTASFTQTYTEPPTYSDLSKKTLTAPNINAVKQEPVTQQQHTKTQTAQNNAKTDSFAAATPAMVSTTQKDQMFNDILPDYQESETDTFAEVSQLGGEKTSNQSLDLSMIFGAKESGDIQDETGENSTLTNTEKVKLSSVSRSEGSLSDVPMTDHSIKTHLPRKASSRDKEEYSDFLGKTKSVFYRIKWSLFKE
jgi:hypothetical protein